MTPDAESGGGGGMHSSNTKGKIKTQDKNGPGKCRVVGVSLSGPRFIAQTSTELGGTDEIRGESLNPVICRGVKNRKNEVIM